jgi:MoxR-like ATPase
VSSRHDVDTSVRLRDTETPAEREIEVAGEVHESPRCERVTAEPYLFTDEMYEAVDIAIALGRPLLLQGDPGCGKTRLAYAVAYRLGLPLERAHVKSTTRAQDLLYTFDAVARLYDVQLGDKAPRDGRGDPRPDDPANYVRLGPFGLALQRARHDRRSVLLIDEIDKADLDFPNDLLHELDRLEMRVEETGETYAVPADRPDLRPIIVVTNNVEKALPPAFLRRCIYHELLFPADNDFLARVLAAHDVDDAGLVDEAVLTLRRIRGLELSRKPGISELLDWVRYLHAHDRSAEHVRALEALGALVKSPEDQRQVRLEPAV